MSWQATPPQLTTLCVCADSQRGGSRDTEWKEVMRLGFCVSAGRLLAVRR